MSRAIQRGALGGIATIIGAAAAMLAVATLPSASAQTPDTAKHMIEGVRNVRYCELIPVVRRGLHLTATVYNTLGLNDCPAAVWDKITEAAMRKRFGALKVMLNGPRHFVMDAIAAEGDTAAGKTVEAGGLSLTARATIDVGLFDLRSRPYRERTIARETRYVFKAGKPVFLLVRSDGARYAMQSYAQIIDKSLSYADLPTLGARLKLPAGWRYETMTPDADLMLGAQGKATVVQDDLQSTYQKLD
ncbi:MAG: hypothetical protein WBW06_17175 [Xanthobacteraceae bacterium]